MIQVIFLHILFHIFYRFAVAVGYYGLTFNVTSLPGNKYINFFIGASVEMLAYSLVVVIIKRYCNTRNIC